MNDSKFCKNCDSLTRRISNNLTKLKMKIEIKSKNCLLLIQEHFKVLDVRAIILGICKERNRLTQHNGDL